MNDIVLAEFFYQGDDYKKLLNELLSLEKQGAVKIIPTPTAFVEHDGKTSYILCNVRMNAETATILMLKSKFFSDRMRISYIPDDFENKFHS